MVTMIELLEALWQNGSAIGNEDPEWLDEADKLDIMARILRLAGQRVADAHSEAERRIEAAHARVVEIARDRDTFRQERDQLNIIAEDFRQRLAEEEKRRIESDARFTEASAKLAELKGVAA